MPVNAPVKEAPVVAPVKAQMTLADLAKATGKTVEELAKLLPTFIHAVNYAKAYDGAVREAFKTLKKAHQAEWNNLLNTEFAKAGITRKNGKS